MPGLQGLLGVGRRPSSSTQVVRKGTASYDFRQWPVIGAAPHTQSTIAARAALAASEQGRYWNYVELFYRNQGAEESGYVAEPFLTAIAKGAGRSRRRALEPRPRLENGGTPPSAPTNAEAGKARFEGTPSFVVQGPGGRRTLTVPTFGDIQAAIQAVK